jgi:hypothetical protein
MQGLPGKILLPFLALFGCAAPVNLADLPAVGTETQSPPAAQKTQIDASVTAFAEGRFTPGAVRWFVLKPGMKHVEIVSQLSSGLRGKADRVGETGPDGVPATMKVWKASGNQGVLLATIAAPMGDAPGLAAYYAITILPDWKVETIGGNVES